MRIQVEGRHAGVVKSWDGEKGFGFIGANKEFGLHLWLVLWRRLLLQSFFIPLPYHL